MKAIIFTSAQCLPCKVYKTSIREATEQGCEIALVDVGENPVQAELYGVRSVPTTVLLDAENEVLDVLHGVQSTEKLLAFFGKKA